MLLPKQSRNYVTGLAAACSLLLIACSPEEVRQVNLIPKPEQMTMTGGTFTVASLALSMKPGPVTRKVISWM